MSGQAAVLEAFVDPSFLIHHPILVLAIVAGLYAVVHFTLMRAVGGPAAPAEPSTWLIQAVPAAEPVTPGYTVFLEHHGDAPINVLRALRAVTGADLSHAKAILDSAPSHVLTAPSFPEAEQAAERLRQEGARVRIESGEAAGERFEVRLQAPGSQPIHTIKLVRQVSGRDLKGAKQLVDAGTGVVTVCRTRAEAERVRQALEAGGAVVTLGQG